MFGFEPKDIGPNPVSPITDLCIKVLRRAVASKNQVRFLEVRYGSGESGETQEV